MANRRRPKKIWQRRDRNVQLAIWAAWLVATALFVVLLPAHFRKDHLGVRLGRAGSRPAISAPAWCRPTGDISINCGGRSGTRSTSQPSAPDLDRAGRAGRLLRRAQHHAERDVVRPIALFIIVSSRSINSLIWALMLVTIVGPGVFAGIIAIGLRSIGFCAKLLYEAIEEIDEAQVEAVRATGASGAQITVYGIVPQMMPAFAGISVFRWDINIRESTVLGLVGAGGIGLELNAAITQLYWTQVSLMLLVIIGTVILSEWVSAKVRHAII